MGSGGAGGGCGVDYLSHTYIHTIRGRAVDYFSLKVSTLQEKKQVGISKQLFYFWFQVLHLLIEMNNFI